MGEFKGTPGPWTVEGPENYVNPNLGSWSVEGRSNVANQCTLADARLIAAAPDLLDALTDLVLYHDVPDAAQDPVVVPLLRNAFAALSRATGSEAK